MIDSTLLETLRHLTEAEHLLLSKYIQSPLFYYSDNASGVINLFKDVMQFAPTFDNAEALNRETIAKRLNKTPQYVTKTASGLHSVVRNFLSWYFKAENEDGFFNDLAVLRFCQMRGLNQRFDVLFNKLTKETNATDTALTIEMLYKNYRLHAQKSEAMLLNNPIGDLNLKHTLDALDAFSILAKARITFSLLFRRTQTAVDTEGYLSVLGDIERFCTQHTATETKLLLIFYEAILLLIDREDADIEQFQKLLNANQSLLSGDDWNALRTVERFFILQKFNKGNYEILPQVFEMYSSHLEEGLLEGNGYLMPVAFANIVRYGCRLGKLDWVEIFLKKYEQRLGGTTRPKELFRLYFAYFLMSKGNWKEAENYLEADFEDAMTRVEARCFELMMLYKTNSDLIDYKVESFRKLVQNTKDLPEMRRGGFHNFALILRKMLNPDLKRNNKKIDKLIADIKAEPTSEAMWLIAQLEKLKKRT